MTTLVDADVNNHVVAEREELPDGSFIWVARDTRYDGCIAQAAGREEAIAALDSARAEYLAVLRELRAGSRRDLTPASGNTIVLVFGDTTTSTL